MLKQLLAADFGGSLTENPAIIIWASVGIERDLPASWGNELVDFDAYGFRAMGKSDSMASTNPELDHYMVLGVERDATQDQIDEAYELAKTEGTVDVGEGGMGPARAADIESAYAVLRDPEKRANYDNTLD